MRAKNAFILVFLSIFIGWIVLPGYATAATTASERIAVSLVIDTSGSMAETDPNHLRKTAADIFVDMLSPEDYVGIVSFATEATELTPMQKVGDTLNKQVIKDTLGSITNADGNTNYRSALEKAEEQLGSLGETDIRKVILFLTDGVPEPDYALREDMAFMSAYMDSVWQTTARLGLKNVAVYTIGFGTVDTSILQRIATDTRGEAKFLDSAGDITVNFVGVLRTLKNRQVFWNESLALTGETVLPFQVDSYTSQVTMAVTNDIPGADVFVRPVGSEEDISGQVNIQKNDQYSILTMNQVEKELPGDWELVITGTGNAQLFGDKDLTLKSWMTSPLANTQVPIHEPIDLSVEVTGELSDEMIVQVIISKNDGSDFEVIPLEWKDRQYVGTYENVDQAGTYILETQILDGETAITSSSVSVSVQQLPVLKSNQEYTDDLFKAGESQTITGKLELDGCPLDGSEGITVSSMNLFIAYPDGHQEILPMEDGGPETGTDTTAGDGEYATMLAFGEEGNYSGTLVVQGTTPGGNFSLEKDLGAYWIVPAGAVSVKLMDEMLYAKPGGTVNIPVQLWNDSERNESILISVESEDVSAEVISISLEPGEKVETDITLVIEEGATLGGKQVSFKIAAEDPLTEALPSIIAEVQLLSASALSQKQMQNFLVANGLFVAAFLLAPLLVLAVGRVIYAVKLKQALDISRSLVYSKIGKPDSEIEWLLSKKVAKQTIVFGAADEKAALSLPGAKIPYRMIAILETTEPRFKCLEGYRALLKTYLLVRIRIETTPPGIFIMAGEVYTSKEIFDQDSFESGGYRFVYKAEKGLGVEQKARNVLEGKM